MKKLLLFSALCLLFSMAGHAQFPGYYNSYNDIAASPQGKVVAVGGADLFTGPMITSLKTYYNGWAAGMGIDWQGEKFIAVADKTGRFNADGTLDQSFGTAGTVAIGGTDVKVLCNGKTLIAGSGITRLLPGGATDPTFGVNGLASGSFPITKIAVQQDAKIVAIGDNQVTRFHEDGTPDATFTQGIMPTGVSNFTELAIQSDGKIVVSATYMPAGGKSDFAVLRFNQNGSIDNTFSGDGLATLDINHDNDYAVSVRLQADNKILVAGTAVLFQCPCPTVANFSMAVARYNTDGTLDESFGEPTTLPVYNTAPPFSFTFDGKGKTVLGSLLKAKAMTLYQDSIYLAGSTAPASKEQGTQAYIATLHNDTYPLPVFNNASLSAVIPDAYALPHGVWPNTVYIGYAPASSVTLTAQTGGMGTYTYAWSTGATTKSITVSPTTTTTYTVTVTQGSGCAATASKTIAVADVRCGNKADKVQLCQVIPAGKPNNICVSASAVTAQLSRGAYLGNCVTMPQTSPVVRNEATVQDNGLNVYILNNPTHSTFILDVQSTVLQGKVSVRIYSIEGKLKETREITPNSQYQFGAGYPAGSYYAEVIQGNNKQLVKLLKLK